MTIEVHNRVSDFNSYRAARVKSLFNAENGCNFDLVIDNVDLSGDWNIGVVVGPSGSGKTSIGKQIFGSNKIYDYTQGWNPDKPIIDDIAGGGGLQRGYRRPCKRRLRLRTLMAKAIQSIIKRRTVPCGPCKDYLREAGRNCN